MSYEAFFLYIVAGCFGFMSVAFALSCVIDAYLAYQEFLWEKQKDLIEIVEEKIEESEDATR